MPSLKTNLLKIQIASNCYVYQAEIVAKCSLEPQHQTEIQRHITQSITHAVYHHPYLYSPMVIQHQQLHTHLSNGLPITIYLTAANHEPSNLTSILAHRLLQLTQLLYSPQLDTFCNPFEEEDGEIVGWKVGGIGKINEKQLWILPVKLRLESPSNIGEDSQVLLDYDSGNFLAKQGIVRIDKAKGQVIFRCGTICRRDALRPITVHPLNGYHLALQLNRIRERITNESTAFCEQWGLKFDSRLVDCSGKYVEPGSLGFRDGERGLAELVSPMSEHNYIYNYTKLFDSVTFDDGITAQFVWLAGVQETNFVKQLSHQFDNVKARMGMNIVPKTVPFNSLQQIQELLYLLRCETASISGQKIYLVPLDKSRAKLERESIEKLLQFFIDNCLHFHIIEYNSTQEPSFQAMAYRHLAIIYTKFRVNPWKVKSIPFLSQPMMTLALHVKQTRQNLLSLALIGTMNLYFTKFTAAHRMITRQGLFQAIQEMVNECIEKFRSVHGRYPHRLFMFRSGTHSEEQIGWLGMKNELLGRTGMTLTYITLNSDHPIRAFNQQDSNYISRENVKKTQMLLYTKINQQLYLQLELEGAPHRVTIHEPEPNDSNFEIKVLELAARVALGGVGHHYGGGLGILDYPRKLNSYSHFNLQPWRGSLREGILMFL